MLFCIIHHLLIYSVSVLLFIGLELSSVVYLLFCLSCCRAWWRKVFITNLWAVKELASLFGPTESFYRCVHRIFLSRFKPCVVGRITGVHFYASGAEH